MSKRGRRKLAPPKEKQREMVEQVAKYLTPNPNSIHVGIVNSKFVGRYDNLDKAREAVEHALCHQDGHAIGLVAQVVAECRLHKSIHWKEAQ